MKPRSSRICMVVAVAVCAVCGCASVRQSGVERQAAEVKVYQPDQLLQGQYQVVRYLRVDSWRSAFWLPSYSSETEGITSLQAEAARLGANGLINVSCRDQGRSLWSWRLEPSILCYGNAIDVR